MALRFLKYILEALELIPKALLFDFSREVKAVPDSSFLSITASCLA